MNSKEILVAGFPESGKTSFLAALWHIVNADEVNTVLRFASLSGCDSKYLNEIAARWRRVIDQERNKVGTHRFISMNLTGQNSEKVTLSIPDLSGEDYRELWEHRLCEKRLADLVKASSNVLLFIHSDRIVMPRWVVEDSEIKRQMGLPPEAEIPVEWSPRFAPTQVQLVDLLQLLSSPPFDIGPRRLAIVMSAWDMVEEEGQTPLEFLRSRLPLLSQYLFCNEHVWIWSVFGVSAIGGQIRPQNDSDRDRADEQAQQLRAVNSPSERVRVIGSDEESHDLTRVMAWFLK
jgi:hypothetical protein